LVSIYRGEDLPEPVSSIQITMTNNLMKLSELAELLEYGDMRSVTKWCHKNKILVAHVGKAKYVATNQIDAFFGNKFKLFAHQHYPNPDQIIAAHHNDDRLGLAESMEAPIDKKVKKTYKAKVERSKASQDFLNKIKRA
jgi:hypothetical protein